MLRYIKGKFYPQVDGTVVIETNSGVGFSMSVAANSPLYKNYEGEEVKAYTMMIVHEDDISLCGFGSQDELDLFRLLISVNGVGPKAGLSILSLLPVDDLKQAIANGDSKTISGATGVGKKTAERVIIDLKDKVGDFEPSDGSAGISAGAFSNERTEAVSALIALGYSKSEAEQAVSKVKENDLDAEGYIKAALKNM